MIKPYIKNGKTYYYFVAYLGVDQVTGKQVRTTRRGFRTSREARLAELKIVEEFKNRNRSTMQKYLFSELLDLWIDHYQLTVKESTLQMQLNVIKLHILPIFGNLRIDKITTEFCQKQVHHWHSYYVKYHNLIGITSRVFDFGISMNILSHNPMRNVIRPRKKQRINNNEIDNWYTKEELLEFLECVKQEDNTQEFIVFRMLAFTGMRKSELLALKWSDIDFNNQIITINKTLATGLDNIKILQTPKTKDSIRTISLDTETIHILKSWREEQRQQKIFKVNSNTFIICDLFGNHHDVDYPNRILKRIIKKYDLKKITVHGFRHTHCSLLFESGATIKDVQVRLGHSDIKTTLDIYTHISQRAKDKTADNFAQYLSKNN